MEETYSARQEAAAVGFEFEVESLARWLVTRRRGQHILVVPPAFVLPSIDLDQAAHDGHLFHRYSQPWERH